MTTAQLASNALNANDVKATKAPISQNSEKAAKLLDQSKAAAEPKAAAPKAPKVAAKAAEPKAAAAPKGPTKKSVVIELISTKSGATIEQIAQAIVDRGMDADLAKNVRVTRLWLTKIGFPVIKSADKHFHKA